MDMAAEEKKVGSLTEPCYIDLPISVPRSVSSTPENLLFQVIMGIECGYTHSTESCQIPSHVLFDLVISVGQV